MAVGVVTRRLGRIDDVVSLVQLDGGNRLVVNPVAALGTDILLAGASAALVFGTKSLPLRLVGVAGGLWSLTAIGIEIAKLLQGPEARYKQLLEV